MISSVLVANRGEIARRVFRTARRMGIATVAVYSEADADAPHVREADQAVLIGPASARESYLVGEKIIAAALQTGAEAIHPGYGFLSENAAFAEAVMGAGLIWIGPPPAAIKAMGLKDAAKSLMQKANVPVTPGYLGDDQSLEQLQAVTKDIGYPVLIKAVAGGGGKGMRRVDRPEDFAAALASCQREAAASFGDPKVLIETYVSRPRHIEVQIFGDSHGNVVHLFERDCSLQRRHQKVIEEAPAPGMSAAAREAVTQAAIKAAKAVNYIGAGTVEFIADASAGLAPDRIWFMEMNTRLQVEHPVTEAVTGVDLVEWQFRVASGEPLPLTQDEIQLNGHAVEARLYAENPAAGFLPSIGVLEHYVLPGGVRVDTGVEAGSEVSPFYDPMIAKLIAHAPTREGASDQLAQACAEVEIWPVKTNAGFLARCLDHPEFIAAEIDTGFIERHLDALASTPAPSDEALAVAAAAALAEGDDDAAGPWKGLTGFRMNAAPQTSVRLFLDGRPVDAPLPEGDIEADILMTEDGEVVVFEGGETYVLATRPPLRDLDDMAGDAQVRSPMPGKVVAVAVSVGDAVVRGQPLLTLEAMKMEHALTAPFDGEVEALNVSVGDQVSEGVTLARLKASS
ncbi:MAG: acetyl/propionyl/methylcrotonyl-CoA carboxylase subunit alpha [Phenylobacterium sp.]|uniref:acetyl/propionyl/methylcrotonyl-CoA carboxylase subunit alpha n=1 Tax=Phenylobacterium sp. TaxID=1871053 RepID=UPI0027231831|nr:acetyl/propionyl/methylcrotonyl-CoA carboxylase subunit alpha [Phenylobacterium sp.]MDO8912406.1 acetyl/propionyl/methylcrotonyl-CoA carboxylase subunit alpha [Phenylobacterium sp.]MDP3099787.1 acetyl/propionyl/methylcrotonyl-CoA carboxylase subunit alpha [Phenylobacterium sp.]